MVRNSGGYGDLPERPAELVLSDVLESLTTLELAERTVFAGGALASKAI